MEKILGEMSACFQEVLRTNFQEWKLDEVQKKNLRMQKKELRKALRNCGTGDEQAKLYIQEIIREILIEKYRITEENINYLFPFDSLQELKPEDKFAMLLTVYKKQQKEKALEALMVSNGWDKPDENGRYCVTEAMVERAFFSQMPSIRQFGFTDRLSFVVQRLYERFCGLGIIDELLYMAVDGISGGVSGGEQEKSSVWIFFHGMFIHLSFLSFSSHKELERVCRNMYRYGTPGQLSRTRGYIVNRMADYARVVVVRPPFAEQWAFFIRKFNTVSGYQIFQLFPQKNAKLLEKALRFLVLGRQVIGITGTQGSGKTTLLMAMIGFIPHFLNLRIQEQTFELHLRRQYPDRNILSFQETDSISGQEGLDLQKKTDGSVNILGEVATAPVASYMIQMGQTASLFTMFTHHANTTKDLVYALRNCLLQTGQFANENLAKQQVVDVVRFDVHLVLNGDGKRFVERITEIIPLQEKFSFGENVILEYENDSYYLRNRPSIRTENLMKQKMTKEEQEEYEEFFSENIQCS